MRHAGSTWAGAGTLRAARDLPGGGPSRPASHDAGGPARAVADDAPLEVLLLERDPQTAALIMHGMEACGVVHRIHWSQDAEAANAAVFGLRGFASRQADERLRLVLLGLGSSVIEDALAILRRLKTDARTLPTPVVVVAGAGAEGGFERSRAMGANGTVRLSAEADALTEQAARLGRYWLGLNRAPR